MNGKQQLVGFIGVALILANLVTNRAKGTTGRAGIVGALFTPNADTATLRAAHGELIGIAAELIGLVVLIVLAGTGGGMASVALVFTIGLALVWAMTRYGGLGGLGAGALAGLGNSKQSG